MTTIYILTDTLNNRTISRHRTIKALVDAAAKHNRAVKRANGLNSYIPTTMEVEENGERREPTDAECEEYAALH